MKTDLKKNHGITLLLLWALLFATATEAADPIPLRAGPVSMVFEPDNAFLRYIKVGPHEILRGITAPVRNQFWGTVLPVVSKVELVDKGDQFTLTFEALCREREIDFLWHGTIKGSASGEIEYTFDGTARSTFQRNRIGFCVLHGPSAAGQPWVIENIRGEKSKGGFPKFISPHQPAKEIREIAHELAPNLWAHVRMEGDTFEMEDQRNWTDASFKTYCTPLGIPYPVTVTNGTRVTQKVTIRLAGSVPGADRSGGRGNARTVLTLKEEQTALPRLGLQVSSDHAELTANEVKRLKVLKLDHLRVDLVLTNDSFVHSLRQATTQARALGVKLHVGLRLGSQPESALDRLTAAVRSLRPPVSVWLILGADPATYRMARPRLGALGAKAFVGAAHDDINFTQLNRIRPAPDMLEVVAYGVTPQIHAFDNQSIMETLPILADTVHSARQFIGASPLLITPITLRLQSVAQAPLPGELPSSVDPRQTSLFAAAWTLGSVKYLAEAGVQGITCYETVGWKGIMESAAGSALPGKFPSKPGEVFPIYDLLRNIGEFNGGQVQRMDSSDTLAVAGLALRHGKRLRLLVANLTAHPQTATLSGLGPSVKVQSLSSFATPPPDQRSTGDEKSVGMEVSLQLPAYGVVRIDQGR
jgi:D-apionolactonase